MPRAKARHILVDSPEACQQLLSHLQSGADFAATAKSYSQCATARHGGDLGNFSPGQMGDEIDQLVFDGEIGTVLGPVQTKYGYHLVLVTERTG